MSRVIVTYKNNITQNEDGTIDLIDSSLVGHLTKTHPLQAQIADPETGTYQIGFVLKAEVFWEHQRSPAFQLVDADDLAWVTFADDTTEVEDEAGDEDEPENNYV